LKEDFFYKYLQDEYTKMAKDLDITLNVDKVFYEGYKELLEKAKVILEKRKEIKTMEYTLPNGAKISGTLDQITTVAKALGYKVGNDGVHYNSSTKGLIRIVDMDSNHLKNALLKLHREWSESLKGLNGYNLTRALKDGNVDLTYIGLYTEYIKRVSRGLI